MTDGTKDQELIRLRTELENATYLLKQEREDSRDLSKANENLAMRLARVVEGHKAMKRERDSLKAELQETELLLEHQCDNCRVMLRCDAVVGERDSLKKQLEVVVAGLEQINFGEFGRQYQMREVARCTLTKIEELGGDVGTEGQSTSGSCAGSPIGVANQGPTSPTQPPTCIKCGFVGCGCDGKYKPHGFELDPPPDELPKVDEQDPEEE